MEPLRRRLLKWLLLPSLLLLVLVFLPRSTFCGPKCRNNLGNQAYKDKNWQRAIGFYTDAIKLNSNSATYYSNRAAAYLELGSLLQAEADCTKAIELDKKNVKAYLRRGTAREMLGYYKKAIEDFRYALVLEPTNKRASLSADRLRKLFQ